MTEDNHIPQAPIVLTGKRLDVLFVGQPVDVPIPFFAYDHEDELTETDDTITIENKAAGKRLTINKRHCVMIKLSPHQRVVRPKTEKDA